MKNLTNNQLAFLLARLTLGINFFVHGAVRLPKLTAFAEGMLQEFSTTILPRFLLVPFVYALPFIEFLLGAMLLVGFKTRFALTASALLIMVLIFGSGLQENWDGIGSQMIYAIFIFLLIKNLGENCVCVD